MHYLNTTIRYHKSKKIVVFIVMLNTMCEIIATKILPLLVLSEANIQDTKNIRINQIAPDKGKNVNPEAVLIKP